MKDLNTNLLRYHQRQEIQHDIDQYDEILPHAKPEDRQVLLAHRERARKQLHDGSPEPLTAAEKDKLFKLEKKLRERITTNMPTDEVMRKNPAGAIDWHQRWEKVNKPLIRMWKNIKIQLNPDSSDKDLANIEKYRPSGAVDRFRSDAQIPGVMSYGNIAEEDWPFDPPKNTALAQAQRRYEAEQAENDVNAAMDRMDADVLEPEKSQGFGPSGNLSAEEYTALEARLAKGREVLARKRSEKKQLDEALDAPPVKTPSEVEAAD